MDRWHGYMGVQDLGLTQAQRLTLWQQLQGLGVPDDVKPSRRCHWVQSQDGLVRIFEAAFNPAKLSLSAMKNRLAAVFGVSADDIGTASSRPTFAERQSTVVTFSYGTGARFRLARFGSLSASWKESATEARAYMAMDPDNWTEEA